MLFLLLIVTSFISCRFVSLHLLEHAVTGQQIILIGDCHGKEQYASENKAAIINLAHAFDAHLIVEDMSDYSLFEQYLEPRLYNEIDFFAVPSGHSHKRMAYTSLSLTHHCKRKGVSVCNVEFRHQDADRISVLPIKSYCALLARLIQTIDDQSKQMLSKQHSLCLEQVLPFIEHLMQDEEETKAPDELTTAELMLCYVLDMLIVQEINKQTEQRPDRMLIICAGDLHIKGMYEMLTKHHYQSRHTMSHEYYTMREIRLQPLFERYVHIDKAKKGCITRVGVGLNDRKRVWSSVAKKAMTGASLFALAISALSVYVKAKYLEQHHQW